MTARVIQGDCRTVLAGLPSECVDLILTDPPYGIRYKASRAARKLGHRWHLPMIGDAHFDEDLYRTWLAEAYRVLRPDRHIYIFCADRHLGTLRALTAEAGFKVQRTVIWAKPTWPPGDTLGDYGHMTEMCVYAMKGRRHLQRPRIGNVLHFPRVPTSQALHPTQKPLALLQLLIGKSAPPGGIVLDPFAGSGSTGVAALLEKRHAILIEADPGHAATATRRIAALEDRTALQDAA